MTEPKPERETWLDLIPPGAPLPAEDQLLTRAEILAKATQQGLEATESDIRYWEGLGILPKPVRRWHEGAVRALYPSWYLLGVRNIRLLKQQGLALSEMRGQIRALLAFAAATRRDGGLQHEDIRFIAEQIRATALSPALETELWELGRQREAITGAKTDHIEVRVVGVDGRKTTYKTKIPETSNEESAR